MFSVFREKHDPAPFAIRKAGEKEASNNADGAKFEERLVLCRFAHNAVSPHNTYKKIASKLHSFVAHTV